MGKRGRVSVMRVVNNHLRFDSRSCFVSVLPVFTGWTVTSSNTTSVSPNSWEESTGLLSSLIPRANGGTTNLTNPQAFNMLRGDLKLGPPPISDELRAETARMLRDQAMVDRDPTPYDVNSTRQPIPGVISPTEADLAPHPPTFRTIDAEREASHVRDARKRIRLEPSVLANADLNSAQGAAVRARALPSICAYTLHDVPEGYVIWFLVRACLNLDKGSVFYILTRYFLNGRWVR
jgi:transcription initiation factor TFIID subunit 5